jgi:hypothetical protein
MREFAFFFLFRFRLTFACGDGHLKTGHSNIEQHAGSRRTRSMNASDLRGAVCVRACVCVCVVVGGKWRGRGVGLRRGCHHQDHDQKQQQPRPYPTRGSRAARRRVLVVN